MAPKTSTFLDLKTCLRSKAPHSRSPLLRDNVPHSLLSAHSAKICFICTQPQSAFFLAKLALQGNRANGKKSFPGRVPGPKIRTKMVPKSGPFQKEFFCSAAKKSPKNWTGPWLSLNMVNGNRFSKWQTPLRNAKCSFQAANPTPPSPIQPCGDRQPERRSNRNVYSRSPLLRDNVPHSLLSAHSAKICFICTQPQSAFFLAKLALQGNRANGKKSFPGRVPGPKIRTKMVPKSGPFQKEFFCSAAKKSPKNWTGPWLSLNMVNGNRFSKWQTPLRNAKCSFQAANPTPPSPIQPCGDRQPERRSNRNVYCGGPLI